MTSQESFGLLNIVILGLTGGASFAVPFIIYAKNQAQKNADKIHEKVDKKLNEIEDKLSKASAELLPAYRNGGIVTSESLRSNMEMLEKSFTQKIDFLHQSINLHNDSSRTGRQISEEKLRNIIKQELMELRDK